MTFFVCPQCSRRYALRSGGNLTFRWGHPISLALYPVIFTEAPAKVDPARIDAQLADYSDAHLAAAVAEIRLELAQPTQAVREILECVAPEAQLRAYLEVFCDRADQLRAARRKGRP